MKRCLRGSIRTDTRCPNRTHFRSVPEAVAALKAAGLVTVVVTNQPEPARGNLDEASMQARNARFAAARPIDAVYVCPHDSGDRCYCRKPAPCMLLTAAADLDLDLAASYMVGDRWRDVGAGRAAGCTTVLIECGYAEPEIGSAAGRERVGTSV